MSSPPLLLQFPSTNLPPPPTPVDDHHDLLTDDARFVPPQPQPTHKMEVRDGGAFGGSPLDRLNNRRDDASFVRACIASPAIRVLLVDGDKRLLSRSSPKDATDTCLGWLDRGALAGLPVDLTARTTLLLGCRDDVYYLAARVSDADVASVPGGAAAFKSLRDMVTVLDREDAAIAAHAVSLFFFHERHAFCGLCGAPTTPEQGGTRLRCELNPRGEKSDVIRGTAGRDGHADGTCSGVWFPRIDVVTIMLVVSGGGDQCLLGRSARFRPGMYSCLAGFLEHGERLEDGACREVEEESGIICNKEKVRYFGCQPWPQPYSLMLGCVVQAASEDIEIDEKELEEARWFTRLQVLAMVTNVQSGNTQPGSSTDAPDAFWVPPATSIAGQMLAAFAGGDPITRFVTAMPTTFIQ